MTPGINLVQRYAIAGLGGVGALSLVCFGIGYMEFRNRRLSGPSQVDDGLGIRVVGTLPALSARKLLDPNHPVIAQLTDSIDSGATAFRPVGPAPPRSPTSASRSRPQSSARSATRSPPEPT